MPRYAKNKGYVGIGIQEEKGTAVWPQQYIKFRGGPQMTPENQFEQYNEGGDGQYPGITIKNLHSPNGSFEAFARSDIATILFGLLLGSDTVTGSAVPYTHTIKPAETTGIPWATLERGIAGIIKEQITDVRITEVQITGEAGKPIVLNVSYQGLDSKKQTLTFTDTYESNNPFIFWQGTFEKDGSAITTINSFNITVRNVGDEADQTTGITRADLLIVRREIEFSATLKVDSTNYTEYYDVLYNGNGDPNTALDSGSFRVSLTYGSGTAERLMSVEIPKIIYTAQPLELDSDSTDSQSFEITGHAEKDAASEFIEVIVKSTLSTSPVALRASGVFTMSGVGVDGDTITIGSDTYELDTDSSVTGGNISVNISADQSADAVVTALALAINANSDSVVTAEEDITADTVTVKAKQPGIAQNSVATTDVATNGTWGAATLENGTDG